MKCHKQAVLHPFSGKYIKNHGEVDQTDPPLRLFLVKRSFPENVQLPIEKQPRSIIATFIHVQAFYNIGVPRNFANFTGKHLYHSLFLNNVADLRPVTLFKKRLWHRWFSVNFMKFLKTFFTEHLQAAAFASIFCEISKLIRTATLKKKTGKTFP